MTKRGITTGLAGTHPYVHDQATDRCWCGLPRRNELHKLPPTSAAARAHDAHVLGEPDVDEEPW